MCRVLDSSTSDCLLGDASSALNNRVFLGVSFSQVNVNMPELCRKVRVALPLGVPSSSGRAISQFCPAGFPNGLHSGCMISCKSYNAFAGLQVLSAYTSYVLPWEKLLPEFTHVCMASVALDQAAEHLMWVFELEEVLGGI